MKPSAAEANEPQFSYPTMRPETMPATAPFVAEGIPVSSTGQFDSSSGGRATFQIQSQAPVKWSTGLCGCGEDVPNCCLTCWCPCVTFGRLAEIVDRGSTSCGASGVLYTLLAFVTGCPCCYSCFYRSKMRRMYSLTESPCCDCLVHCCCESCALCQEYRELKNRGFDMVIGWHGNLEKQTPGIMSMLPPSTQSGMAR